MSEGDTQKKKIDVAHSCGLQECYTPLHIAEPHLVEEQEGEVDVE